MIYTSKHIGKNMPADLQPPSFTTTEAGSNVGKANLSRVAD